MKKELSKVDALLMKMEDAPYKDEAIAMTELAREQAKRIEDLENALRSVLDWGPVPPDDWPTANQDEFLDDMVKARDVLDSKPACLGKSRCWADVYDFERRAESENLNQPPMKTLTIHYEPNIDNTLQERATFALLAAFQGEHITITDAALMREIERQNDAEHRLHVTYPDTNGFTVTSTGRFFSAELTAVISRQ